MKPPPFRYHDPQSVAEAIDLLARHENAKLLAGGQSLMPMLNMRYAQPDDVIDLNNIAALAYIRDEGNIVRIGAMTRQRDIEFSEVVKRKLPLVYDAIRNVGHRQTRNRGTLGGSLAHLDPAAELPLAAAALGATIHAEGKRGKRDIAMKDFPRAYMTPAIEADEIVTGASFPCWPDGHGHGFVEFSRRQGDFAIVAAAALLALGPGGAIVRVSLCLGGVGPGPLRCAEAEGMLAGKTGSEEVFRAAAETCRKIEAMEDVYAPAAYRRHLAAVLARRALVAAWARARKTAARE